ncbi:MAG: hypothetical protein ACOCZS_02615 [Verrucomicrobiota bacterium]
MDDQFFFGLDSEKRDEVSSPRNSDSPDTASINKKSGHRQQRRLLIRSVMAWLNNSSPAPTGFAANVPTRLSHFQTHIGAFISKPVRNKAATGPGKILEPQATMIFQCYTHRENCWSRCARAENILPELRKAKEKRDSLQLQIQKHEPELKDPDSLFEEYAEWRYEETGNPEYHRIQKEISNLEHALLEGTPFEQLRNAEVANYLYLAVPAGEIVKDELADSWGLLWVHPDLQITVEREPAFRHCPLTNQYHFVQNVAAAASRSVNFAYGLHYSKSDNQTYLVKPPRGHRRPIEYRLDE